ncbi:MAG TPA: histidine kinase [Ruminococcaceae bacterium]|jgi:two-component system sensor histidine kinase YesM|nr:histidine kinase [Oscillospiraceae bacterium]HBG55045.1 histidine kinase [Oscillospiraceae bacterium]HBQ46237.1 histidine kinase [Oscillospiraceae bacterium]
MNFGGYFKNGKIGKKLFSYFMCLIVLSIASLSTVSRIISSQVVEQETDAHTVQMIEQVRHGLESYITGVTNIIYYLSKDPSVVGFLMQKGPGGGSSALRAEADEQMRLYISTHPEIAGILVVNGEGLYASNEMKAITRDSLTGEKWYRDTVKNAGRISIISRPMGRNLATTYGTDSILSIAQAVPSPTGGCLGVILVDFKLDAVKGLIQNIALGGNGFIFVTSASGEVVYTPVNAVVYRVRPEWLKNRSGNMNRSIRSKEYRIIYGSSSLANMKIVGVFSLNELFANIYRIRSYTILIGLVMSLLALAAALLFTSSIARPIRDLGSLMKKAESGDFSVRFVNRTHDEIGQLGECFNMMIARIKNLVDLLVLEQKSKREAELRVLESQIKPHFLYNTLETIQVMAQEHHADDIVRIVRAMTTLFRISLNKGREVITVADEIRHVESYLFIQKMRYEDKLNYIIFCEPCARRYSVIKLILQPIVENALYHGIKEKRGPGLIRVSVSVAEGGLLFTVWDNGAGIPPEDVALMNGILQGKRPNSISGFGLQNVSERIRLAYGNRYGLSIQSEYGKYTLVKVKLPLVE